MSFPKEEVSRLKMLQKSKKLLDAVVTAARVNKELKEEELVVEVDGVPGIIPNKETDHERTFKNLSVFVGMKIKVCIKGVPDNEEYVICSRAMAQKHIVPKIKKRLKDGDIFDAKIINIFDHGALVDIDGFVGFLKNLDFSDDFTTVSEKHSVGDTIKVKLNNISETDKYNLETVKKHNSTGFLKKDDIRPGNVYLGVVLRIMPWGVFVTIGNKIDVLCDSFIEDIEPNNKVRVKIKRVKQSNEKLKINGYIIEKIK